MRGEESCPGVARKTFVAESKISSVALATPFEEPPAISTLPSGSLTAAAPERAAVMGAAAVHLPVKGSKISAVLIAPPPSVVPPATRTRPSGRDAQMGSSRGYCMGDASRDPVFALNVSAAARIPLAPRPPAIRTLPSLRFAAHAPLRAIFNPTATALLVAAFLSDAAHEIRTSESKHARLNAPMRKRLGCFMLWRIMTAFRQASTDGETPADGREETLLHAQVISRNPSVGTISLGCRKSAVSFGSQRVLFRCPFGRQWMSTTMHPAPKMGTRTFESRGGCIHERGRSQKQADHRNAKPT